MSDTLACRFSICLEKFFGTARWWLQSTATVRLARLYASNLAATGWLAKYTDIIQGEPIITYDNFTHSACITILECVKKTHADFSPYLA